MNHSIRWAWLSILASSMLAGTLSAADILVTNSDDSGEGSLRDAINQAASGDRIVFDLSGPSTITLLSDLPTVSGDLSFANANVAAVTVDRNGNAALTFDGGSVDPTTLNIIDSTAPPGDPDISATPGTTIFGDGQLNANITAQGTIALGRSPNPGNIGTLDVDGDLDARDADLETDITTLGTGMVSSDQIQVTGTATVTDATLVPNFIGSDFEIGDQIVILSAGNPIAGTFQNQGDAFAFPDQPFLQAVEDTSLANTQFGLVIEDNDKNFAAVVNGCNQTSAAQLLDYLRNGANPPAVAASIPDRTGHWFARNWIGGISQVANSAGCTRANSMANPHGIR